MGPTFHAKVPLLAITSEPKVRTLTCDLIQRCLVDDRAARRIDQNSVFFQQAQTIRVQQPGAVRVKRREHADDIARPQ